MHKETVVETMTIQELHQHGLVLLLVVVQDQEVQAG
jgi:hypothetical protein